MPFLRPGQGFQEFHILKKQPKMSASGTPGRESSFEKIGEFKGILATTSPSERETWKQNGYEVTNHVVTSGSALANKDQYLYSPKENRIFLISTPPKNPGGLNHCTIYYLKERGDLQYVSECISSAGSSTT